MELKIYRYKVSNLGRKIKIEGRERVRGNREKEIEIEGDEHKIETGRNEYKKKVKKGKYICNICIEHSSLEQKWFKRKLKASLL